MIVRQKEETRQRRKTQTRRCVKAGEFGAVSKGTALSKRMDYNAVYTEGNRLKWAVGRDYPVVPKMYQKAFGRICIEAIRAERLHDITEADAIAEGVASIEEYKALWESINGETKDARWADNPRVWVITFRYLGDVTP